ncbi:retrovirus-related pol polyprotein from transposon TNT 1-94 [Tanacetum coccineum]|uniref:Retrovirus-related pol polyprotein from transposon TNT 1-94 n=1 Tax=Tanacetum coccineum TaxID=301880 RepID=A0ABQ5A538_9ASTR
MPKEFWAGAVDCAVYLLNWCPSKSLDNKTPQRNGIKPTVSHPRIFMSITYLYMQNQRYDFLPMTDEEETCESGEEVQQPESLTPTPTLDSPLSSSEGEPKTRRMQELYERQAIEEEINSIEKNNTWYLTTLLTVQKAIGDKWVYKARKNAKGELEKYKARLMAKGYKHKHGIDYVEVFAPDDCLER